MSLRTGRRRLPPPSMVPEPFGSNEKMMGSRRKSAGTKGDPLLRGCDPARSRNCTSLLRQDMGGREKTLTAGRDTTTLFRGLLRWNEWRRKGR
jgi:hypothetical protein